MTSAVQAPSWPIFASFGPTLTPAVFAGTRNTAIPGPPGPGSRVRANTTNKSASGALVMKRFCPSRTQPAPSRRALVRRPAGSSGAGLGQRERGDDLAGRDPLQPLLLLRFSAEVDQHLSRDAVVGAEHRPQREGGVAELHRELDVLPQVQPETAPFRGYRVPEQAHLRRGGPQVVGDAVRGHDLVLPRHDVVTDEAPYLGVNVREVLVANLVAHASRFLGAC